MIHENRRGNPRPVLSPRYCAASHPAMRDSVSIAAAIPAIELRRLVAAMVD